MDIQDLKIFARAAVASNFTSVALEFGLTPGTISKRIQQLESELGVRLFHRSTRSVALTDEGSELLTRVEPILASLNEATAWLDRRTKEPSGLLRVAVPAALGRSFVANVLSGFLSAFPDITVQVDMSDRHVHPSDGGYDVAIRMGALTDSEQVARRLAFDTQVLVASPAYLARNGVPAAPDDLSQHNCFSTNEGLPLVFAGGAQSATIRVKSRLSSTDPELLLRLALDGEGVLHGSELLVADEVSAGRLVRLLPDFPIATNSAIWVVYPSRRHMLPKVRVLLDYLTERFRPLDGARQRPSQTDRRNVTPLKVATKG